MAYVKNDSPIGKAVEAYTGCLVTALEVVADPNVRGCFAVQATVQPGPSTVQFLVRDVPLQKVTDRDLEECEFTSWPPACH